MNEDDIRAVFVRFNKPAPPILLYDQLTKLTPCIFLYRGKKVGHWCAILRHEDSWEIFDPVGLKPDAPLDHPRMIPVPKKLRWMCLNQEGRPLRIYYNDVHLQAGGKSCGLWCIFRYLHKHLDSDQFTAKFRWVTDADICQFFNRMDLLN